MNDRPTPETDALAVVCYGEGGIEASHGFRAVPIKDCRKLERERDEAREELAEAKREAENLAKSIYRSEYSDNDTDWEILDSVAGVISQIDNMYAGVREQRDEAREKLSAAWQSLRDSQDEVLRLTFENRELSQSIKGWENKWKCAVDMAARAELERDEALKCAKEYYVEFIRNASSDNKVSKPNPLNPFYKY